MLYFQKKNCLILKQYKTKKAIGRFSSVYGLRLTITISYTQHWVSQNISKKATKHSLK